MYHVKGKAREVNRRYAVGNLQRMSLFLYTLFLIYATLSPVCGINEDEMIFKDPASVLDSIPEPYNDPKMNSQLQEMMEYQRSDGYVPIRGISDSNRTILVDIYLNTSFLNDTLLLPHFKEIKVRHRNVIEGDAYLDNISAIRNLSFVKYIDIPPRLESCNFIHDSELLQRLGVLSSEGGDGIVVAVLDGQFYTNKIINMSLPKNTIFETSHKYISRESHGTACCEVISQIAPDIKLYQIHIEDNSDYQFRDHINEINDLEERIDIVSCSMGLNWGPGLFGVKDDFYYAIENLTKNGTIWVNSAGNDAEKHWSGSFNDPDGNGCNNFSGADESINVTLKKGQTISVHLTWNDWSEPNYGMSDQDYKLYILGPNREKVYTDNPQKGIKDHKAKEHLLYIAQSNGIHHIMIKKMNATENGTVFHLFTNVPLDEYVVPAGSLNAVSCYQNVLAVGAFNSSSGEIEPYSSRGPANGKIIKPDLVAPTNIWTVSTYPNLFDGTSAAAPTVAGCIALVMNKQDSINSNGNSNNRSNIIAILKNNCKKINGHCLPDNTYGNGLINLNFLNI